MNEGNNGVKIKRGERGDLGRYMSIGNNAKCDEKRRRQKEFEVKIESKTRHTIEHASTTQYGRREKNKNRE